MNILIWLYLVPGLRKMVGMRAILGLGFLTTLTSVSHGAETLFRGERDFALSNLHAKSKLSRFHCWTDGIAVEIQGGAGPLVGRRTRRAHRRD